VYVFRTRGKGEALEPLAPRAAAHGARGFDDDDGSARALQRPRRAEAREAGADYEHVGIEVVAPRGH